MEENKINENITDTNAIVGMILGILSVILCWVPVIGLVLGIVALILSIKGLKNSRIINKGKGLSVTGKPRDGAGAVFFPDQTGDGDRHYRRKPRNPQRRHYHKGNR